MATIYVYRCLNCKHLIFADQKKTPEEAGEPGSCRACGRANEARIEYIGSTSMIITPPV